MDKSLILLLRLLPSLALAQTHTLPGSNVVPSGASLTVQSGGSITAAAGSTVTGFGGGGGTPGGSNTQVQYNNSGAFGGMTGSTTNGVFETLTNPTVQSAAAANVLRLINTNVTSKTSEITFFQNATKLWGFGNDVNSNGGQDFYFYDYPSAVNRLTISSAGVVVVNSGKLILGNTSDTGLARNAAGVVEINNGTAGTFADLITKSTRVNALTVATLPASPTLGQVASVSDGTAALAWGATVTGGASTKYLVWWNGAAWTVIGK